LQRRAANVVALYGQVHRRRCVRSRFPLLGRISPLCNDRPMKITLSKLNNFQDSAMAANNPATNRAPLMYAWLSLGLAFKDFRFEKTNGVDVCGVNDLVACVRQGCQE
jgi:hypothetical protein